VYLEPYIFFVLSLFLFFFNNSRERNKRRDKERTEKDTKEKTKHIAKDTKTKQRNSKKI